MNLYRAKIEHVLDDVIWEFEAENDQKAWKILENRAKLILVDIIDKKIYLLGRTISQ